MNRAILALALMMPTVAAAQTVCAFSSTPGMAFGVYDDSSAVATNSATDIVVRCARSGGPANVNATLLLGPSASSGSIAVRQMRSGANAMNYNLYRDAARTQVWGQTAGVDTVTLTVSGIPNNGSRNATFTIYGRIPALQSVPAGGYADSVQITVSP